MSLRVIRGWFKDHLERLGFEEHEDGFNTDNIGEVDLDRVFHTRIRSILGAGINHTDQRTESDVELRVFFKGNRNASLAMDDAILEVERIVKECCNIKSRTSDGILNVVFERASLDPRGEDNDNSVLVTFDFTVSVLIGVEE